MFVPIKTDVQVDTQIDRERPRMRTTFGGTDVCMDMHANDEVSPSAYQKSSEQSLFFLYETSFFFNRFGVPFLTPEGEDEEDRKRKGRLFFAP